MNCVIKYQRLQQKNKTRKRFIIFSLFLFDSVPFFSIPFCRLLFSFNLLSLCCAVHLRTVGRNITTYFACIRVIFVAGFIYKYDDNVCMSNKHHAFHCVHSGKERTKNNNITLIKGRRFFHCFWLLIAGILLYVNFWEKDTKNRIHCHRCSTHLH